MLGVPLHKVTGESYSVFQKAERQLLRKSGANIKKKKKKVFAFFASIVNGFAGAEITRDLWEARASCARFRRAVDQRGTLSESRFPPSAFP